MCVRIHVCGGGVLYNSLLQVNERVRKALDLCLQKYLWDATGGQQWLLVQQDHALLVVLAAKKKKKKEATDLRLYGHIYILGVAMRTSSWRKRRNSKLYVYTYVEMLLSAESKQLYHNTY